MARIAAAVFFVCIATLGLSSLSGCSQTIIDPLQSISIGYTAPHDLTVGTAILTDTLPLPDFASRKSQLSNVSRAKLTAIFVTGLDTSTVLSASAALNGVSVSDGFRQSQDTLYLSLSDTDVADIFKSATPILSVTLSTTAPTPLAVSIHTSTLFIAPYLF